MKYVTLLFAGSGLFPCSIICMGHEIDARNLVGKFGIYSPVSSSLGWYVYIRIHYQLNTKTWYFENPASSKKELIVFVFNVCSKFLSGGGGITGVLQYLVGL